MQLVLNMLLFLRGSCSSSSGGHTAHSHAAGLTAPHRLPEGRRPLQGHPVALYADLDGSLRTQHFPLLSEAPLVFLQQVDAFLRVLQRPITAQCHCRPRLFRPRLLRHRCIHRCGLSALQDAGRPSCSSRRQRYTTTQLQRYKTTKLQRYRDVQL